MDELKQKRSKMGKNNRRRGQSGEREVCGILTDYLGSKITRELGQARDGGCDVRVGPFVLEIKRRAKIAGFYDWLEQATDACIENKRQIPVVAARADGERWLVTMRLEDWILLARDEV
jgi:hypothetical protein